MSKLWLLCGGFLILAGCQPKATTSNSSGNATPGNPPISMSTTGSASTDTGSSSPTPTGPGTTSPNSTPNVVNPGEAPNATEPLTRPNNSAAPAEKPIDKPGTGNWKPTKLKMGALASNVGSKFKKIADTYGSAKISVKTPEGSGQVNADIFFGTNGQYRIGYVIPKEVPMGGVLIGNGSKKVVVGEKGQTPPMDMSESDAAAQALKSDVLGKWPMHFTRAMMMGRTDGWDAWSRLAAALQRSNSGYNTFLEQRETEFRGQTITNYRILAIRKPELVKAKGKSEFEIVVDGTHWLPVTMRSSVMEPSGRRWEQTWRVRWQFKQVPDKTLFEF